jgi:hypothetical protein
MRLEEQLIIAYQAAVTRFIHLLSRAGSSPSFFTRLMHVERPSAEVQRLGENLEGSSFDTALEKVIEFLVDDSRANGTYSFKKYFLDELRQTTVDVDWECFTDKAVRKYQGPLYRGTSHDPTIVFVEGIHEKLKSKVDEDYVKVRTGSIGISTTKDFEIAKRYALSSRRALKARYIYVINYRGEAGYDVIESGKSRGSFSFGFFDRSGAEALDKMEVNIRESISPDDIVGAWLVPIEGDMQWLENENYLHEIEAKLSGP